MAWMTTCCHGDFNRETGEGAKETAVPGLNTVPVWDLARGCAPMRHVGRCSPCTLYARRSSPACPSIIPPALLMADSLRPRLQSLTGSILSHRVVLYSFASTLAVSATVVNALQNHSNFYSVAVYLSKSGASVLVSSSWTHSFHGLSDSPLFPRSSPILACSWL